MTDWRSQVYSAPEADRLPHGWKSLRRQVIRRDQQRCQRCRSHQPYQQATVHHILPRSEGGGDHHENLMVLCGHCHDWVECADPPLRSRAAIQGSYGSAVDVYEVGERPPVRPDWHSVVYGGQRAA